MARIYKISSAVGIIRAPIKAKLTHVEITAYRGYLCFNASTNAEGVIGTPFSGNGKWIVELEHVKISPKAVSMMEKLRLDNPNFAKIMIWKEGRRPYISWQSHGSMTIIKPSLISTRLQYDASILKECGNLKIPQIAMDQIDRSKFSLLKLQE